MSAIVIRLVPYTALISSHLLGNNNKKYPHLAIDDIQFTLEDSLRLAKESIKVISQLVDEAYEKILSRVPSRRVDITRKILQVIVAARRPLTTAEMAIALGIATSPQAQTTAKAGLESS